MNLRNIASNIVSAINPKTPIIIQSSAGSVVDATYKQQPQYTTTQVMGDVQAMAGTTLERMNNLGIQGVMCVVYLDCQWHGLVRVDGRGGDVLKFNGQTWLVVQVLENWATWSKLALCLQTDPE